MKRVRNALTALTLSTSTVFAATSVDINVTATTDAAACIPTLSNGGVVNFGDRPSNQLAAAHYTQWGSRDITLSIVCEASTAVAISARDSRSESMTVGRDANGNIGPKDAVGQGFISNPARLFGLGKTAEGQNIGSYAVIIDVEKIQALNKGIATAVTMVGAGNLDATWSSVSPTVLSADMTWFYTFATPSTGAVQPISSATVPLRVSASIASGLSSRETITLDGRATISLVYL